MSAMPTTLPAPEHPARRTSVARVFSQVLGELMITAGVILLLLVVYQLWWTNIQADRKANEIDNALRDQWSAPAVAGQSIPGDAIGIMYIERLGRGWEKPVVQGVDLDHLAEGVGHFPKTALPGQVGNFAVAAHRATHGEPFAHLDEIRPGDQVILETRTDWFIYTVDTMPGTNGKAWKLVDPNYGSVVAPVPEQPGVAPTRKLLTLVTCNPRWGHSTRLIVYGHLTNDYHKPGALPAELAYTKKG